MLSLITNIVLSGIIQLNGIAILPPLIPPILQKAPSKELQKQLTEAELREQIIQFGLAGDHVNMCLALDSLGEFYDSNSRTAEAEFCYLAALKSIKDHYGTASAELAYAYGRISGHYVLAHDYNAALKANIKAIRILNALRNPDQFKLAILHHNQAWLEAGYSSFRAAEQHYNRSIVLFNETIGPDHLMVGLSLNNLGNVYLVQKKYDEAEKAFAQAYKILLSQKVGEATMRRLYRNYADVLHKVGKHKLADEVMSRLQDVGK